MITSKQELKYYLECDKKALGINYKRPRMFTDKIWRYQRSLRWLEYYTNVGGRKNFIMKVIEKLRFHNLSMKLGFSIPINTFGPGLAIVHYGTIVVAKGATIGANCRIHEGVTIGATNGSSRAATIGDNVFIGSGAKIIGDVTISSNVAVAANAVVVNDIICENGCTVGGVPAKIISSNNSSQNIYFLRNENTSDTPFLGRRGR